MVHEQKYIERIWSQVNMIGPDDCWEWIGRTKDSKGRGYIKFPDGSKRLVYRVVKEQELGKQLERTQLVCHSCDNPKCVNPNHLWVGSQKENIHDMLLKERGNWAKGATHHRAKLTVSQVKDIRVRISQGETQASLALKHGVSETGVWQIVAGKSWVGAGL